MRRDTKSGTPPISGFAPEGARSVQPIPPIFILRDVPGIAAIEAQSAKRGIEWQDEYIRRCDAVSRSLFGVTEADTRPTCPDRHTFDAPPAAFAGIYRHDDLRSWEMAYDAWDHWCRRVDEDVAFLSECEGLVLWEDVAADLTDGAGALLKCLPRFVRQFVVATAGLHPAAKFTPEGAASDPSAWGAALEADAARFKSGR